MSATRTFSVWSGTGTNGAITAVDPATHTEADKIRNAIDIAAYLAGHLDLGGDERTMTIVTPGTWRAVNGARSYDLNGDSLGGMTLEAVVFYYTSDAATTVNVRLRNTTDSSNAGTITSASAATTVTREVFTVTLASGIKTYQLQWDASNTTNPVVAYGYLRLRKVPA